MHMNDKLLDFGDRALLPVDDPHIWPVAQGLDCTLRVSSQGVGQTQVILNHLTYRITMNSLRRLFGFLYEERHAGSAVAGVRYQGLNGRIGKWLLDLVLLNSEDEPFGEGL